MATTLENQPFVLVSFAQWQELSQAIKKISETLSNSSGQKTEEEEYITAEMFMQKAHISRSTFDEIRLRNEIKVVQKGRKLYTTKSELHRYFNS